MEMRILPLETPRSAENLPSGSMQILKRYISHNKQIKELTQKYSNAVRASEWGEAAEHCQSILTEIDKTIGDLKGAPGKMSSALGTRILCSCLVTIIQCAVMLKSSNVFFTHSVWQGITTPVLRDTNPTTPTPRTDLDTITMLLEGSTSYTKELRAVNAEIYGVLAGIITTSKIISSTVQYLNGKRKDTEEINPNEFNPLFRYVITDLERMKESYMKLLRAVEAERDAQIDDAIEAFITDYEASMDFALEGTAMEGATVDAIQTFRFHNKQARELRSKLNKLRKAGQNEEAAKVAQEISKCASNTIRDIDLLPDDILVPQLTDLAVIFLGSYISGAILNATVGKFFSITLNRKNKKIDKKMGAGTNMSEAAKATAATKNMKRRGAATTAVALFMGNPLGTVLNKISQKASGDKEEWGDNDRNVIINALRIQAKHVRDKYAKLATQLRSGKDPGEDKEKQAVESFNIFGMDIDLGGQSIALESALQETLGDENYAVFEAYLDSVSDEEWLDAAEEGFSLAIDEYEEVVLENDFAFMEALEGQSAKKDIKAIFKQFKKNIRAARSEMKKCERKKDWSGAADAAQKASDIAKSMLQECDAVPPDTKGTVLAWLGFIVVEVLLAAVVMAVAGTINGVVKDLPGEVDKAYYRTIKDTAKNSAKDTIKGKLAHKLHISPATAETMKNTKDGVRVAMRPSNAIKVSKERIKGAVNEKIRDTVDKQINGKVQGPPTRLGQKPVASKLGTIVAQNGANAAVKNIGTMIGGTLNGPAAKQGRAVGGGIVGGLAGFKAAQKIGKTASLLFKKKAMTKDGSIDGSNISVNDFHPMIAAMKHDIATAAKRYEAYAKMYRQRGKTEDVKSGATESWIYTENSERQDWLFG